MLWQGFATNEAVCKLGTEGVNVMVIIRYERLNCLRVAVAHCLSRLLQ
jgi:hypothetical protein